MSNLGREFDLQFSNVGQDGRIWFKTRKGKNWGLRSTKNPGDLQPSAWYVVVVQDMEQAISWGLKGGDTQLPSGGFKPNGHITQALQPQSPPTAHSSGSQRVDMAAVSGVLKSAIESGLIKSISEIGPAAAECYSALAFAPLGGKASEVLSEAHKTFNGQPEVSTNGRPWE